MSKESKCKCPVCGSHEIEDISRYKSNGILGHGARTWIDFELKKCKKCGVLFQSVNDNCTNTSYQV